MNADFAAASDGDLARLVAEAPLCWIVPGSAPAAAILMPVVLERDASGRPASLLGHLPLGAPAARALADDPAATFLFLGPNRYISPAMAGRDDWAPTWNFASAKLEAAVSIDPALTRAAIEALVAQLEGPRGWTPDLLGERYDRLLARIVGFRASIDAVHPRFKLGQDEAEPVYRSIVAALEGSPLGDWMDRAAGR